MVKDLCGFFLQMLPILLMVGCSSRNSPLKAIPDPSVIDPKNPPVLEIRGLKANDLIENSKPLAFDYSVRNYPLGENWQKVAFRVNSEPAILRFSNNGSLSVSEGLKKGPNVLRAYLLRAWDESLKNAEAYVAIPFFYADRAGLSPLSAKLPVLTLVSPRGKFPGESGKKILFDFLVKEFPHPTEKNFKIRYSLNGAQRELMAGKGVYFENLPNGKYVLRLDVLNKTGFPLLQDLTHEESFFEVLEGAKL
jgi:hypothetical protein